MFSVNDYVRVAHPVGSTDWHFQGMRARVVDPCTTPHGYVRVKLETTSQQYYYGCPENVILLHPESLERIVYPHMRLYRTILQNVHHRDHEGRVHVMNDYNLPEGDQDRWPFDRNHYVTLYGAVHEARFCEDWYAAYGVILTHTVAIHRAWTVEYVEVNRHTHPEVKPCL